jgi:hypothetical protein
MLASNADAEEAAAASTNAAVHRDNSVGVQGKNDAQKQQDVSDFPVQQQQQHIAAAAAAIARTIKRGGSSSSSSSSSDISFSTSTKLNGRSLFFSMPTCCWTIHLQSFKSADQP